MLHHRVRVPAGLAGWCHSGTMPRVSVPDVALRALGRQLGGPSGPLGVLVARKLNKGNAASIRAAIDTLDLSGTETVADIGFGGGLGLDLLLDASMDGGRVHGVEPATTMLTRARKARRADLASGRLELHEATMESLPFPDSALNAWISVNTIYFVDDLRAAFRELARVLAPGGRGVIGMADPEWMARQPFTKHGFTLRPVTDVLALLESAGLTPEHRTIGEQERTFHLLVGTR